MTYSAVPQMRKLFMYTYTLTYRYTYMFKHSLSFSGRLHTERKSSSTIIFKILYCLFCRPSVSRLIWFWGPLQIHVEHADQSLEQHAWTPQHSDFVLTVNGITCIWCMPNLILKFPRRNRSQITDKIVPYWVGMRECTICLCTINHARLPIATQLWCLR